jgi:hypothetical protein
VTAGASLLQGTWLLHHHQQPLAASEAAARLYFAWHIITISLLYAAVTALILRQRRPGKHSREEDVEKTSRGGDPEEEDGHKIDLLHEPQPQFSSLRSGPGTASTLVSQAGSSQLDESFLQKQMPVYSNTLGLPPPPGLSVLPNNLSHNETKNISNNNVQNANNSNGSGVDLIACGREYFATAGRKAPAPSPPPAAVSTPSSDRLSATTSPTTAAETSAVGSVLAVATISLASPAPSNASTAPCSPGVGVSGSAWPPVVEAEPVDRISPIEEYNTLSRHIQSVRASIKLKESRII